MGVAEYRYGSWVYLTGIAASTGSLLTVTSHLPTEYRFGSWMYLTGIAKNRSLYLPSIDELERQQFYAQMAGA